VPDPTDPDDDHGQVDDDDSTGWVDHDPVWADNDGGHQHGGHRPHHHIVDSHYDLVVDIYDDDSAVLDLDNLDINPDQLAVHHRGTTYHLAVRPVPANADDPADFDEYTTLDGTTHTVRIRGSSDRLRP
jgi:hypothetical protein